MLECKIYESMERVPYWSLHLRHNVSANDQTDQPRFTFFPRNKLQWNPSQSITRVRFILLKRQIRFYTQLHNIIYFSEICRFFQVWSWKCYCIFIREGLSLLHGLWPQTYFPWVKPDFICRWLIHLNPVLTIPSLLTTGARIFIKTQMKATVSLNFPHFFHPHTQWTWSVLRILRDDGAHLSSNL